MFLLKNYLSWIFIKIQSTDRAQYRIFVYAFLNFNLQSALLEFHFNLLAQLVKKASVLLCHRRMGGPLQLSLKSCRSIEGAFLVQSMENKGHMRKRKKWFYEHQKTTFLKPEIAEGSLPLDYLQWGWSYTTLQCIEWPPKLKCYHPRVTLSQIWDQSMSALLGPLLVFGGKGSFGHQQKPNMQTPPFTVRAAPPIYSMFTPEKYLKRRKLSRCQRSIKFVKYLRRS